MAVGELARAATNAGAIRHDAPLADLRPRVLAKKRMTFRNETGLPMRFRLYLPGDEHYLLTIWPDADFEVREGTERAVVIPFPWSLFVELVQVVWGGASPPKQLLFAHSTDLVIAQADGTVVRTEYYATARTS
jgi:hypothetical protein